jgi:hypothetical protein
MRLASSGLGFVEISGEFGFEDESGISQRLIFSSVCIVGPQLLF